MPGRPHVTIVAPHPDDEVFGVGGLMRELVAHGHRLMVVAVTDGEAAFGAAATGRTGLVACRDLERRAALVALGVERHTEVVRLGFPDAAVADHEHDLAEQLAELCGPVVLATWRHDGHPDHEATGRAAARAAAARPGCRLLEYPVWAGHRGRLAGGRPRRTRRVRLSAATRVAKARALQAFRSQLEPSPDGRPVVPAELIDRLATDDEVLFG